MTMVFQRKAKSLPKADNTRKKHVLPEAMKQTMWKPGQSPNPKGRPKGSRNKLGEAFVAELLADFEMAGTSAIQACRLEEPARYCSIIASILPKELNINDEERLLEKFLEEFTSIEEIREFRQALRDLSIRQSLRQEGTKALPRA